jgi:hypothetical protein
MDHQILPIPRGDAIPLYVLSVVLAALHPKKLYVGHFAGQNAQGRHTVRPVQRVS